MTAGTLDREIHLADFPTQGEGYFQTDKGIHFNFGTTVPADATVGYAPGALFLHSDGSGEADLWYMNVGTKASSNFDAIDVNIAEAAFLSGVTAGTGAASKALVLNSSGVVTIPAGGMIDERNAEVVTTTNIIAATENGKTFYLNAAGGFTSTLPAPAIGLKFTFIIKTAPTTAYIITTTSGADIMYGMMLERAGTAGVAGAARDTFNFVANQAIIGDWVEFHSDGTNWYYHGMVDVATGNTVAAT